MAYGRSSYMTERGNVCCSLWWKICGKSFKMSFTYAQSLYKDPGATLGDLREAVTTLEDAERTARRVFGGGHPLTATFEHHLRESRAALRARETPSSGGI